MAQNNSNESDLDMLRKGQHINAKNSTAFEQFYALAA
jgi:hypothetical protein